MGVSKGEGGGRWSPPNGWRSLVLGEGGPCRIWRSGGFPKLSRKIFPLKPFSHLFSPFFTPSLPSSKSTTLQNPPSNSLDRVLSPFLPLYPFFLLSTPSYPPYFFLRRLSDTLRTPPESLHKPFLRV